MSKKIKVDFFQVEIPDGLPNFESILRNIHRRRGDGRAYELNSDSSAWLLQFNEYHGKLEGNFVRGRHDYLPKKGKRGEETTALDLEDDDEVTDESAFIFDTSSGVLALQRNKYGLSRKGVEYYLTNHQSLAEPIILKPLTKAATLSRLDMMTSTKKMVVRIAKPQEPTRHVRAGASANEMIDVLNKLDAPTLRIEASVGKTRGLLSRAIEFAKDLLARADRSEVDVLTLQLTGEIESEPTFIDLVEDKLIAEVPVESSRRRALPYSNRKVSLRKAWEIQLPELREYGVTS